MKRIPPFRNRRDVFYLVHEEPTKDSENGIYIVKPKDNSYRAIWAVVWGVPIKLMSTSDGYTKEEVDKIISTIKDYQKENDKLLENIKLEISKLNSEKADRTELANVVAGLVPMGSVANLAELEAKPKRNNDAYYVEDQLSPEGNAYIYRWDAGLNLWVNTKQVVFKDVITQGLGDSSNKAMSQKAVTDELAQLESEVNNSINTKSGYSNLVNSADAFRVEDTAGTRLEQEDRVTLLKKLDNSIVSIEAFNLPEGHHIGITTLNISRVEGDSTGANYVAIWDENGGLVHGTIDLWKYEMDDPSRVSLYFGRYGILTNVKIVVDATALGLAEGERYTFYFGDRNVPDYKKGGFKDNSIINLPIRSMWDLHGYNVCKRENRPLISDYEKQIHDIWKGIYFEATKNVLVKFNSARYNSVIDGITLVIYTCSDDDPSNLNVTAERNKFSRKIVEIPFEKKGLARFYAKHLADLEDNGVDISVIVDTDALFEGMASIPTHDIFTTSVDDRAHWIVSPSSGGDSTKRNRLILADSEKDYQGNFSFSPTSTDWIIDSASNLTKIIRIPDGTTSIDFSMDFNGGNSEALFFDKDMKYIERLDNYSTTNVVPPVNAIFLMASTKTPINSAKIVAKGVFEVTDSVKSYRSIHEGLGDRYSGVYFEVNGFVYKKDFNGLCTIDEYSSTDNGWLDEIPMLEVDEDFKSPQNVLHTDGITTYNGGLLCAVKDGVMYFTNHRDKAIFKSNDGGVTFTTIVDSLSHPNVWDPIDVDKESRSVIIPLDNGELLFPIRHRGTVPLLEDRNERFYVLYRTTNNQTDLERCFTFSHEDCIRDWLPSEHPNYLWPNHSGGAMLGNFSHSIDDNIIVVTEYGVGSSKYWQTQVPPVSKNGNGVSAKAWVSFDYGVTWKKMFDADRKKVGTVEADDNWYYFSSTYEAKMRHIHGIALDKKRGVVQITNGDGINYIWKANISDIKLWYDTAPSINDDEHPVYKSTDTFPLWEVIPLKRTGDILNNTYSFMTNQMMKSIETPKGWLWGHDASRQMACLSYYSGGEYVFEPVFSFEMESDYETFEDFFNSGKGTTGFPQDIVEHEGIIYFLNSGDVHRIWATSDGINWKIVCEVPVDVNFAARLMFDDNKIYISYHPSDAASRMSGYYELNRV